jgi:uracil-DNA glycosylase
MLDDRKPLEVLEEEWAGCTKCPLGERRQEVGGAFVFGEGRKHGVMFIGEGPGQVEEAEGRPFVGPSGKVLRKVIERLGLIDYYITNCVACRSCAQAYNGEGQPIFRKDRRTGAQIPFIRDEPPTPLQIAACLPRLHELIYLVDPVVIVTLGAEATKTLRGKAVSILSERGQSMEVTIPGSWQLPVLTEKRQQWARRVRGELVMPTRRNEVRYLVIPTIHPAFVLRSHGDKRKGNPLESFIEDVKKAVAVYDRYILETYGIKNAKRELEPQDLEGIEQ